MCESSLASQVAVSARSLPDAIQVKAAIPVVALANPTAAPTTIWEVNVFLGHGCPGIPVVSWPRGAPGPRKGPTAHNRNR